MPGKILRRCTICKKFHASYLVEDPDLGKCYLCLSCWNARSSTSSQQQASQSNERFEVNKAIPGWLSKDLKQPLE